MKIPSFARTLLIVCVTVLATIPAARAGTWEISLNGSYFKSDNGIVNGRPSETINRRLGGGVSYSFLDHLALELAYDNSLTKTVVTQSGASFGTNNFELTQSREGQNLSLNLVVSILDKKARFQPFVKAGGGYYYQKQSTTGFFLGSNAAIRPQITYSSSLSADAGLGFKLYIANHIAFEMTGMVYATGLDDPPVLYHYSLTGGLRFVF